MDEMLRELAFRGTNGDAEAGAFAYSLGYGPDAPTGLMLDYNNFWAAVRGNVPVEGTIAGYRYRTGVNGPGSYLLTKEDQVGRRRIKSTQVFERGADGRISPAEAHVESTGDTGEMEEIVVWGKRPKKDGGTGALGTLLSIIKRDPVSGDSVGISVETDEDGTRTAKPVVDRGADATLSQDMQSLFYGLGDAVGSTIGDLVGGSSTVGRVISRGVFSVVTARLGLLLAEAISSGSLAAGWELATVGGIDQVLDDIDVSIRDAGIGTVSSLLMMEFADALGIDGLAGEVFGVAGSSALGVVGRNIFEHGLSEAFRGFGSFDDLFANSVPKGPGTPGVQAGAGTLAVNALASFLGQKLGSLVISPQTQAGAVLGNLGAAAGTLAFTVGGLGTSLFGTGATFFGSAWAASNILFPGVGAFVGFIIGTFLGNLFGRKKPKVPTADAETVLSFDTGYYRLGAVNSANGGNREFVTSMALAARDSLNGLIQAAAGDLDVVPVSNTVSPTQKYGHKGNQVWAEFGGQRVNFASADQAVDWGVLRAIKDTRIAGGDILQKRVLSQTAQESVAALGGDLKVAEDYAFYLRNRELINGLVLEPWNNLSQADRDFFTANQAVVTRLLARAEVAPSQADLTFYSAHQATVDRITNTLKTSEFSAGWMITLQRAAELRLDQFAPSDFYGGLRGFLDSFAVAGEGAGYGAVSLGFEGAGLRVAVAGGRGCSGRCRGRRRTAPRCWSPTSRPAPAMPCGRPVTG